MELSDLLTVAAIALPAAFVLQKNLQAYGETSEWLQIHNIPPIWNEQACKNLRDQSVSGYLTYYLCYPGRKLAYRNYKKA